MESFISTNKEFSYIIIQDDNGEKKQILDSSRIISDFITKLNEKLAMESKCSSISQQEEIKFELIAQKIYKCEYKCFLYKTLLSELEKMDTIKPDEKTQLKQTYQDKCNKYDSKYKKSIDLLQKKISIIL